MNMLVKIVRIAVRVTPLVKWDGTIAYLATIASCAAGEAVVIARKTMTFAAMSR
jgi:hypothetical protein